jgi:hypothetical protein
MEVHHKHGPIRNWREFLKEYGIIVLGVLTALGAEQAVETIHHRTEVRETREALNEELGWNFASFAEAVDRSSCISARLGEIDRWQKSWADGRPKRFSHPIVTPSYITFHASVWRVSAGDAVSRMPLDQRIAYARLYDGFDLTDKQRALLDQSWADLSLYQNARRLSDEQQLSVARDIETIRSSDQVMVSNYERMLTEARKQAVVPSRDPIFAAMRVKHMEVCRPLL